MSDFVHSINLAIFVVDLVIAALMLLEVRRLRRGTPSVIWAFVAFFAIDSTIALNRSELFWEPSATFAYATTLDVMALIILLYVFTKARVLARSAFSTLDLAALRADEYERARRDYTQVVRHRIMNPLTIIEGAARTLESETSLDPDTRAALLHSIVEAALILRDTTLEPERRGTEEYELDAIPRIDNAATSIQQPHD